MSAKTEEKPRVSAPVAEEEEDDYSSSDEDYSSADDDDDYEEEVPRQQQQALAQRQGQQQGQQQQQPGQVSAPQAQAPAKEKGHSGAPSVRLDLNIELEVTLKARIHGDLTLALLGKPKLVAVCEIQSALGENSVE
ncbi:hypothetical protein BZA05DRAFT_441092 [Tricharina praecox]|uniref:uncharacterized protein n=1 Tax=Tricharina praecox TaxID=43433 RepID=UPI0022208B37|nr:uncharacterized protein BZA05DRAFT_441092 [Tricharina praecox]KAI5857788.1 hypothetical protein BZA05DRAFT_441092 [Tricharina praecox]